MGGTATLQNNIEITGIYYTRNEKAKRRPHRATDYTKQRSIDTMTPNKLAVYSVADMVFADMVVADMVAPRIKHLPEITTGSTPAGALNTGGV